MEKKCSDKAQVHLFAVSIYVPNQVLSDNCYGPQFYAETTPIRHHSASNVCLIFAGRGVASILVMSHTYHIYQERFIYP